MKFELKEFCSFIKTKKTTNIFMNQIEPPNVFNNTLHWGTSQQYQVFSKTSTIYSCFPINRNEIIAITSNSIVRLEKTTIKEKAKLTLSTAVFIKEFNIVVGISSTTSEFVFIRPYDLSHSIFTNVRTKQVPCFHILFSPTSSLLITAGKNTKIWNLKCSLSANMLSIAPVIEITLRTEIDSYFDIDLINPPLFDYQNESLILPRSSGYNSYSVDNQLIKPMSKMPMQSRTSAAYRSNTRTFLTVDQGEGVCEWNQSGSLLKRTAIGNTSTIACRFLNDTYLVLLDSKNYLYLYDIKTMRLFLCEQLTKNPSSLCLFNTDTFYPSLAVCIDNSIVVYQVLMPWTMWRSTILQPHFIRYCPRPNKAARIIVHTDNEYIYMLSPKTALTITSASPSSPTKMHDAFYDRGLHTTKKRDQLFIVSNSGDITISSPSATPCEEILMIESKAAAVFECYLDDKLCYGIASLTGELVIHDYDNLKPIKRFIINVGNVVTAKYDWRRSSVLLFYDNEVIRFDLRNGNIMSRMKLSEGSAYDFQDQLALVGYKTGRISMIWLEDTEMHNLTNNDCVFHSAEVTGFAFAKNFFISVSLDQNMKLWSFSGSNIMTISLPLPLYSVEILNGYRDIIVGTDKDIMIIEGKHLFNEKFEEKDDILDNYNEKDDSFTDDASDQLKEIAQLKQDALIARKIKEEQEAENQNNKNTQPLISPRKKREIDEETRRRIIEKMTKMSDGGFLARRIAESEQKRYDRQRKEIEALHDEEREKREKEREEKAKEEENIKTQEKIKQRVEEFHKQVQKKEEEERIQQQLEAEEHAKKLLKEAEEREAQEKREEEEKQKEKTKDDESKDEETEEEKQKRIDDEIIAEYLAYENSANKAATTTTTNKPKKKKKKANTSKKNHNNNNNNPTGIVYISDDGKKFTQLANGDWVDEDGKVYHKNQDGTLVDKDGNKWDGPDASKGQFQTADGKVIDPNEMFQPENQVFVNSDGTKFTSLGDGRWVDANGNVYTMNADGNLVGLDGTVVQGPGKNTQPPDTWIGSDGKVYHRQEDGRYVAEDGTVWDKPMDGSAGGYFQSLDGSKRGDEFVDENGNVYKRTSEGWVGSDGKLYKMTKDGRFFADDGTELKQGNGKVYFNDNYNPDDVYIAADGTVYKRTPSNRGWIGSDGKIYRLNKDGKFVAEDGTIMSLSNEKLCWIDKNGNVYRPVGHKNEWRCSNGNVYRFNGTNFVAEDGSTWAGPSAQQGKFAGNDLTNAQVHWIDLNGTVYKPLKRDGSVWINSEGIKYIRQPNGEFNEEIDMNSEFVKKLSINVEDSADDDINEIQGDEIGLTDEQKKEKRKKKKLMKLIQEKVKKWKGPGKEEGNWVNNKGQIIEVTGGYWISPNKKIYTATKCGYISSDGVLYQPMKQFDTFRSIDGERMHEIGKYSNVEPTGVWVEANGDEYRPIDNNGNWAGPNNETFSPTTHGNWVGQTTGAIWEGPPFISARKYFIHSNVRWEATYDGDPKWKTNNYEVMIGKPRSSTPLYHIPPLLYPPVKSKYKAFPPKPYIPKRRRVVYTVPPPNIVCDPQQVVRLIMEGNTALITLAKRLGLDKNNAELDIYLIEKQNQSNHLPNSKSHGNNVKMDDTNKLSKYHSTHAINEPKKPLSSHYSTRPGNYEEVNRSISTKAEEFIPAPPSNELKSDRIDNVRHSSTECFFNQPETNNENKIEHYNNSMKENGNQYKNVYVNENKQENNRDPYKAVEQTDNSRMRLPLIMHQPNHEVAKPQDRPSTVAPPLPRLNLGSSHRKPLINENPEQRAPEYLISPRLPEGMYSSRPHYNRGKNKQIQPISPIRPQNDHSIPLAAHQTLRLRQSFTPRTAYKKERSSKPIGFNKNFVLRSFDKPNVIVGPFTNIGQSS